MNIQQEAMKQLLRQYRHITPSEVDSLASFANCGTGKPCVNLLMFREELERREKRSQILEELGIEDDIAEALFPNWLSDEIEEFFD